MLECTPQVRIAPTFCCFAVRPSLQADQGHALQGPDGQQSKAMPTMPSYASVQSDAAMTMLSSPTRVIVRTAPPSSAQAAAIEAASRKRQREQEESAAAQKRARQTQQPPPSTHSLLHLQQSTTAPQQKPTQVCWCLALG